MVDKRQTFVYAATIGLFTIFFKLFFRSKVEWVDKKAVEAIQGPVIIAPNHVSYFDPPLISAVWLYPLHFFASSHLFESKKWFGWYLKKLHSHPVNRKNGAFALKDAIRFIQKENKSIVVFPEGTRSQSGQFLPLEHGVAFIALKANCPIIPTYICGTYEAWPKTAKFPKLFGNVFVRFGAPIFPCEIQQLGYSEKNSGKAEVQALTQLLEKNILQLRQ